MPNTVEVGAGIFDLMSKQLDTKLASFQAELQDEIQSMLARGMTPEQIQKTLIQDLNNESGVFAGLNGKVGGMIDTNFGTMTGHIADEAISDLADLFEWVLEPGAEHCETCEEREGQQKTYAEWQQLGLPGGGTTICKQYCKCTLFPV